MHAWQHALQAARESGAAADLVLMQGIVRYIREFPSRLHHPKEEQHLFQRLRERTATCNAELDELERQHVRDGMLLDELASKVESLARAQGEARVSITRSLELDVAAYARFLWDHMGREEGVILPQAKHWLQPEDWAEIEAAFIANRDPDFGGEADRDFRKLFSRIVNLA
jgi:hemerythrin-like domain-containing protein